MESRANNFHKEIYSKCYITREIFKIKLAENDIWLVSNKAGVTR